MNVERREFKGLIKPGEEYDKYSDEIMAFLE